MSSKSAISINPDLDLVFEPQTPLTIQQIWSGWTDSSVLPKWFCPKPWQVTHCMIDLRPGGEFYTKMQGPAGEVVDNHGCLLDVNPHKRLVMTNVFQKDLRPVVMTEPNFPNVIELEFGSFAPNGKFRAIVRHASAADRARHEAMGFPEGWEIALKQLEAYFSK